MTTPADIKLALHQLREKLKVTPLQVVTVDMDRTTAELFVDFLINIDPDMARAWRQLLPQPWCKVLGPIVGDQMMNVKLQRLDDLADKLGPLVLLLGGMINQLERR